MDIASMSETVKLIESRLHAKQFTQHVVVNVAKIVNMQRDPKLAESVHACNIINIDGMGVVWGLRALGQDVPARVAGIDLFHELLAMSEKNALPVFLLGAKEAVLEKTVLKLQLDYESLNIAGNHHGYFWGDEADVVEKVRSSGAKLLFVAITSPQKENFIHKWQQQLGVDFVMGVGGTFDVVAGETQRAPSWMQRSGLEWLYRTLQEPRRLAWRYIVTNTIFLYMLLKEKMRQWFG
jgi:N-acetylglucosaminyldiphosphoundecaprenol N-acetyl-beta-D-mannosaminyltransferase